MSTTLQAGPVDLQLSGIDLRDIRLGGLELVQRLYFAFRDDGWGTVEPVVSNLVTETRADGFTVSFDARAEQNGLAFAAAVTMEGNPDGTIVARMRAEALSACRYNRVGFCVLHPLNCIGGRYRATVGGQTVDSDVFPTAVAPQVIKDGLVWPIVPSYDHLEMELDDGQVIEFQFEGDLFEMEDQRNWTDASLKTYSTPLSLGFPHEAAAGEILEQTVRISFPDLGSRRRAEVPDRSRVTVGYATDGRLPAIGLGLDPDAAPPADDVLELLRQVAPAHLRVDVDAAAASAPARLAAATQVAADLGSAIEVAVVVPADGQIPAAFLQGLAATPIARMLVFLDGAPVSDSGAISRLRETLDGRVPRVPLFAGTDIFFTDLNRGRPDLAGVDGVVFPITPGFHATDDVSLMENVDPQETVVASTRLLYPGLPVAISPVTLLPRFNPHAAPGVEGIPIDPRQADDFAAAWTLGSVARLAQGGAASVTYYETVGPRGIVIDGVPTPSHELFALLAGWQGAQLLDVEVGGPRVFALGLSLDRRRTLLLANPQAGAQEVEVELGEGVEVFRLDGYSTTQIDFGG